MRTVVTGAAGFIGSHLTESLLAAGQDVLAIDACTDYYSPTVKQARLAALADAGATVSQVDLSAPGAPLVDLLAGAQAVHHLAAQPGVRLSWDRFDTYLTHNVAATQALLAAAVEAGVPRVVLASSSSVYGNAERYPTVETDQVRPHSPYGVTKVAAEELCRAYCENHALSVTALRYFTVYGPRQRPDMAMHRLVAAAFGGPAFPVLGDGSQVRDFTYVGDVVAATALAGESGRPGYEVLNISSGQSASLKEVIDLVGQLAGRPVPVEWRTSVRGDVQRTGGATDLAQERLGWRPAVQLIDGLTAQVEHQRAEALR